jgi:hypothetical protein
MSVTVRPACENLQFSSALWGFEQGQDQAVGCRGEQLVHTFIVESHRRVRPPCNIAQSCLDGRLVPLLVHVQFENRLELRDPCLVDHSSLAAKAGTACIAARANTPARMTFRISHCQVFSSKNRDSRIDFCSEEPVRAHDGSRCAVRSRHRTPNKAENSSGFRSTHRSW